MRRRNCFRCGHSFYPESRSDQIFCCARCRIRYYAFMKAKPKCVDCYKKNDCSVGGINYKGKRRPRNCPRKDE